MRRIEGLIDLFLQPGEYFVADDGYQLRTMLGSCVSITLWSPYKRIGAMSHFLLPSRGHRKESEPLDARYGDEAMELMLSELRAQGISSNQCQAKIFGGGNMFPDYVQSTAQSVGQRNGEAALSLLNSYGIPIVSESLFGVGHRQIIFDVRNGDVWCQQLPLSERIDAEQGDLV